MTPEQQQEIERLRDRNLSAKQIARQLGLRPAEVTAIIKATAETANLERVARGELAPLHRCLINDSAAIRLLKLQPPDALAKLSDFDQAGNGFAQIFVTRKDRNQLLVGSYLVDYWCLGVKDTFGPRKMDQHKYDWTVQKSYSAFDEDYQEISLEQAQSVIFGAIAYAANLGFSPHADFEESKILLGTPPESLIPIEFGQNGKPFYYSGPYDNPMRVLSTLRQHVGDGNFDYMIEAGSSQIF